MTRFWAKGCISLSCIRREWVSTVLPRPSAKPEKGEPAAGLPEEEPLSTRLGFKPREIFFDNPDACKARRDANRHAERWMRLLMLAENRESSG